MPKSSIVVEGYHKDIEIVQAEHLACLFEVRGGPEDCVYAASMAQSTAPGADHEVQFRDKATVSTRT